MDTIWECMNVASRIAKQIENSDALVPRNQVGVVTPMADLQELSTTVNSVRTTLVPFVTSSKKTKVVSEPSFEINIKGIKDTLNDLHQFFKDLEKEFSVYTWKTQKVKVYQLDFSLKQKLDQFTGLFNTDAEGSPTSSKKKVDKERTTNGASVISDPEGRELWTKSFGESTIMVPWNVFFPTLEAHQMASFKDDEEFIKMFMDFTKDDHIGVFPSSRG
eukprot:TRINITY_DN1639_c0_g2_i2.p1 TRINITY_DN1639_c0_g2~~TRINITY_DN1639_c0_g2_i2.p1  ORF type:complete len:218 (-),score=53.30 TRINITY_DN1639_c0_g2_i2:107-760(-)